MGPVPATTRWGWAFSFKTTVLQVSTKYIPVRAALDSGLTTNMNVYPGGGPDGRSQSYAQFTVDSGTFYGRDNRVTITADPNNEYVERVESDDSLVVVIPRQPRPANSQLPLNCNIA